MSLSVQEEKILVLGNSFLFNLGGSFVSKQRELSWMTVISERPAQYPKTLPWCGKQDILEVRTLN